VLPDRTTWFRQSYGVSKNIDANTGLSFLKNWFVIFTVHGEAIDLS
jgi:hypothetical protein